MNDDNTAITGTNYIQYSFKTFICEPGDEITFENLAFDSPSGTDTIYEGGFIGHLKVSGTGGSDDILDSKTYEDSNIFSCNPSCDLSSNEQLSFHSSSTSPHYILEYSGNEKTDVKI